MEEVVSIAENYLNRKRWLSVQKLATDLNIKFLSNNVSAQFSPQHSASITPVTHISRQTANVYEQN